MPQFHIHTLGCKVNRAESETIAAALIDAGWTQCAAESADVAIVNTCTVTGEADTKNRKIIRGLLKAGAAHVIVTGCAINIASDHYAELGEAVVCEPDKTALPRTAQLLVQGEQLHAADAPAPRTEAPDTTSAAEPVELNFEQAPRLSTDAESMRMLNRTGEGFRTRVDVKIQDGCNNACTYCIVHVARGRARSIPASQVIGEVGSIANAGTREVVLVGIDLGAYDDNGLDLADLMEISAAAHGNRASAHLLDRAAEPETVADHGACHLGWPHLPASPPVPAIGFHEGARRDGAQLHR